MAPSTVENGQQPCSLRRRRIDLGRAGSSWRHEVRGSNGIATDKRNTGSLPASVCWEYSAMATQQFGRLREFSTSGELSYVTTCARIHRASVFPPSASHSRSYTRKFLLRISTRPGTGSAGSRHAGVSFQSIDGSFVARRSRWRNRSESETAAGPYWLWHSA